MVCAVLHSTPENSLSICTQKSRRDANRRLLIGDEHRRSRENSAGIFRNSSRDDDAYGARWERLRPREGRRDDPNRGSEVVDLGAGVREQVAAVALPSPSAFAHHDEGRPQCAVLHSTPLRSWTLERALESRSPPLHYLPRPPSPTTTKGSEGWASY